MRASVCGRAAQQAAVVGQALAAEPAKLGHTHAPKLLDCCGSISRQTVGAGISRQIVGAGISRHRGGHPWNTDHKCGGHPGRKRPGVRQGCRRADLPLARAPSTSLSTAARLGLPWSSLTTPMPHHNRQGLIHVGAGGSSSRGHRLMLQLADTRAHMGRSAPAAACHA